VLGLVGAEAQIPEYVAARSSHFEFHLEPTQNRGLSDTVQSLWVDSPDLALSRFRCRMG
jgi:hypothetical protein